MLEHSGTHMRQFISFEVEGELFGFDIRLVKEITPAVQITPVPLNVNDVRGVVNIRGQVVVVLDLRVSLGGTEQRMTADSQIVILKTSSEMEAVMDNIPDFHAELIGQIPVGFLVGSVGDIVAIEPDRIEKAPPHLVTQYRSYVEGIVHLKPLPLVILNSAAILGGVNASE